MNLKEWARAQGVGYSTARRWFDEGRLPVPARRVGGLILVGDAAPAPAGITVVYACVSSADQKPDLDWQVARVTAWATAKGLTVGRVVTETGSALDGKRRRFLALLRDPQVAAIAVEHRDRFASPSTAIGRSPGVARRPKTDVEPTVRPGLPGRRP